MVQTLDEVRRRCPSACRPWTSRPLALAWAHRVVAAGLEIPGSDRSLVFPPTKLEDGETAGPSDVSALTRIVLTLARTSMFQVTGSLLVEPRRGRMFIDPRPKKTKLQRSEMFLSPINGFRTRNNLTRCYKHFVPTALQTGALPYGRATAPLHPSTRMQATLCPGESSRNSGSIRAHSSIATGQRVRKRHPEGGLRAVGTSPFKIIRSRFSFGSGTGIADKSACV